jgi:hypothetical protein
MEESPSFSPDGRSIVFQYTPHRYVTGVEDFDIWIHQLSTTVTQALTEGPEADISPGHGTAVSVSRVFTSTGAFGLYSVLTKRGDLETRPIRREGWEALADQVQSFY